MKNKIISSFLGALILCFAFLFTGCGEDPKSFEITTQIHGAVHGIVNGGGSFLEGTSTRVTTTEHSGHTFMCWLHDGKVVSTLKEYTFNVNEQTAGNYLAVFNETNCEFVSLNSFVVTNNVPVSGENVATITKVELSMGYNQNELVNVFACTEDSFEEDNKTVTNETIYSKDSLPFAFEKTKSLYIKIVVSYLWNDISYVSQDVVTIPAVPVEDNYNNLSNKKLSIATNPTNSNLKLAGSENSTISISFTKLSSFFEQTEN